MKEERRKRQKLARQHEEEEDDGEVSSSVAYHHGSDGDGGSSGDVGGSGVGGWVACVGVVKSELQEEARGCRHPGIYFVDDPRGQVRLNCCHSLGAVIPDKNTVTANVVCICI